MCKLTCITQKRCAFGASSNFYHSADERWKKEVARARHRESPLCFALCSFFPLCLVWSTGKAGVSTIKRRKMKKSYQRRLCECRKINFKNRRVLFYLAVFAEISGVDAS